MIWITRILSRMLAVGIAFIIFGIMDNGIMIIAGDVIDGYIGAVLGASALLSAGLGNTISDAAGILSGRFIEGRLSHYFPMKESAKVLKKWQIILAELVGIVLGCLIGLFPLLFL